MTELNPNQQQYDLIQGNIPYAPILPNQFPNYGVSDQTIDYNFQIRNKPTFSRNLKSGAVSITGTGTVSVTLGFVPTKLQMYSTGNGFLSIGTLIGSTQFCIYNSTGTGGWSTSGTYIIVLEGGGSGTCVATGAFTTTGFSLNVTSFAGSGIFYYIAET